MSYLEQRGRKTLILMAACGIVAAFSAHAGWSDLPMSPNVIDRRGERLKIVKPKVASVGYTAGFRDGRAFRDSLAPAQTPIVYNYHPTLPLGTHK